jgi:peptidoglycan/xylan/chitin deacetylase (PgdA/CDA1 family)
MSLNNPLKSINLVLTYHSVPSSEWFRNTLKTIKKIYKLISINEIESFFYNNKNFKNCCHICFDDGNQSVYKNAFPVLLETNTPVTLFVSPKVINEQANYWFQELFYIQKNLDDTSIKKIICSVLGCEYKKIERYMVFSIFKCMKLKDILLVLEKIKEKYDIKIINNYNINRDQLLEMNNSNLVTIGAHTMNHPILSNESESDAQREISLSIKELSLMTGKPIKFFAYPNGKTEFDYGEREQIFLKKNNIKLAFNTDNNFFNKISNPFSIPRSALSGLNIEKNAYLLGKLFCIPVWNTILDIRFFGKNEMKEREEIRKSSIFEF